MLTDGVLLTVAMHQSSNELNNPLVEEDGSPDHKIQKLRSNFGGTELTETIEEEGAASGFGAKKIGWLGSWSLLFNNITGPGMISLISIYITCGWLPATLLFVVVGVISGVVSDFLIYAMKMVPGNENFNKRVELMYLAKRYLGKPLYLCSMFFFLLNIQLNNIGSIIVSTQQMDWTIMAFGAPSYALELFPDPGFVRTPNVSSINLDDSPFGDAYVISIGFLIVLAATVPLGYLNLDDNIWVQIICCGLLVLFVFVAWFYEFFREGIAWDTLPALGQDAGAQVGNIFFNYAYVITIPSWINEKKDSVNASLAIWSSLIPGILSFCLIGALGAMTTIVGNATRQSPGEGLDLTVALGGPTISLIARISTFVFPWVALVNGVPVMSIIIRYNLLENKICNKMWANLFAVVFPWLLAVVFYAGNWVQVFLDYGSVITTIPLNLMLPCYLYIVIANAEGYTNLQSKRNRILSWIFLAVCGAGNILTLVFQIISSIQDAQPASNGTDNSSSIMSMDGW